MIIVTGGAGFIGSNLVRELNARGIDDILIVDSLKRGEKHLNLNSLEYRDFVDYNDFLQRIAEYAPNKIQAILHQGACTDTMEYDGQYMMRVNYEYSKTLLHYAMRHSIRLIYASSASVYGNGDDGFVEERHREYPLNVYAYSKFQFDQYLRRMIDEADSQIVGLRYFNVYGPQENHKERMASVIFQFHNQLMENSEIKLFEGSGDFRRDFIYVGDVVKVNLHFLDNPDVSGIYNCGTGTAESFLKIAEIMQDCYEGSTMSYVPFPETLKGKYQAFTQADTTSLRSSGFNSDFTSLDDGVRSYVDVLKKTGGYWR
ncbi:MAG: ADP-glyceromanno-heptose 6-epimerase [Calditrichia bacterium]